MIVIFFLIFRYACKYSYQIVILLMLTVINIALIYSHYSTQFHKGRNYHRSKLNKHLKFLLRKKVKSEFLSSLETFIFGQIVVKLFNSENMCKWLPSFLKYIWHPIMIISFYGNMSIQDNIHSRHGIDYSSALRYNG